VRRHGGGVVLRPRGPRSGASYAVSHRHHLIDPIRPTREHIATSRHGGLYPMPSLCGSAEATRGWCRAYLVCELNGNARWPDAQHLISECSLNHRSSQSLYPATTCVNHASSTAEIFVQTFHPRGDLIPTVVRGGITLSGLAHRFGEGRIPGQPADGRA
jgi:hypothetical protein